MISLLIFAATMTGAQLDTAVKAAPSRIRNFIERRESCHHWSGEEPYDKARAHQINAAIRTLKCNEIEATEKSLRRAYRKRPTIIRLLDQTIEWPE